MPQRTVETRLSELRLEVLANLIILFATRLCLLIPTAYLSFSAVYFRRQMLVLLVSAKELEDAMVVANLIW